MPPTTYDAPLSMLPTPSAYDGDVDAVPLTDRGIPLVGVDSGMRYQRNGLGVLSDGLAVSSSNYSDALSPWLVGYNVTHSPNRRLPQILFRFASARVFHDVEFRLVTNKARRMAGIRRVWLQFSMNGVNFDRHFAPLVAEPTPAGDSARVAIHGNQPIVARFVKLTIFAENDWLLLSEITFQSSG
ncbi:hypothetical protein Ciccas_013712 [Cichlidogyrus casuarinus]|uniref:Discoidin domain-containing protein n=1 Tax=Cichlidogyrus casuarinus TaxID=1844966 RepID=A0ABD2PL50_9PLAT